MIDGKEENMFFSDYLKQFSDENSVRGDLSRDFIKSKSKEEF